MMEECFNWSLQSWIFLNLVFISVALPRHGDHTEHDPHPTQYDSHDIGIGGLEPSWCAYINTRTGCMDSTIAKSCKTLCYGGCCEVLGGHCHPAHLHCHEGEGRPIANALCPAEHPICCPDNPCEKMGGHCHDAAHPCHERTHPILDGKCDHPTDICCPDYPCEWLPNGSCVASPRLPSNELLCASGTHHYPGGWCKDPQAMCCTTYVDPHN